MTFKHILIPTDGTDLSQRAIATAVSLAAEEHAKITGLHVNGSLAIGAIETNPWQFARELSQTRETAAVVLRQVEQAAAAAGVDCETYFEDGFSSIPAAIAHVAQQRSCDLVVMGTLARHGIAAMLQPSKAKAVAKQVEVPILVVH